MPFMYRFLPLALVAATLPAADTIRTDLLSVTLDQGRYVVQAQGQPAPFASGMLLHQGAIKIAAVDDAVFGAGQAIAVIAKDGSGESLQLFPALPFVLHRCTLVNDGSAATVLNKVPLVEATIALAAPPDQLACLGTGGLHPLRENPGSYAWMAVADPATRAGVVGGWLSHERGSGVVFATSDQGRVKLEARIEYGHLRIAPGASVVSETFALGWFEDARLGLEAWADAVAKRLAITLPPMPIVYCTWYDNVHGGSSNARALAELSRFAGQNLTQYGLSCIQIDDGWQMGDSKGNGPRKNFSAFDAHGPYGEGMLPMAGVLHADGLTAGLWMLPFGATWNDPFFSPHQEWFVKNADGKPYDTAWGGTALDMSNPDARAFVQGEVRQAVHDWGYRYLKLDGLSTGIGVRPQYVNDAWKEDHLGDATFHDPAKTNIEVFRDSLRMIRKAAGEPIFILGCCAPQNMRSYAGVFGLVDAMRMGPDNSGSWDAWKGASPVFGTRNYHLNGRIWWSDPDPIYVRASIPLESARCIASWNALSGQMISISDWLPTLPAERLDIIRRCIPGHRATARPIDLFSSRLPGQWLVTDQRPYHQRRDVLGLFNWSDQAQELSLPVAGLGLPPADKYIAFDFWNQAFIKPFQQTLTLTVPASACRTLAVRPLLPRPFLLSTSRHVSQGIVEVSGEAWDGAERTLSGTSAVVANDRYELRVVAMSPGAGWTLDGASLTAVDVAAGVTIAATSANGLVRIVITSPVSRAVAWTVHFAAGAAASGPPAMIQEASASASEDGDQLNLRWKAVDGVDCEVSDAAGRSIVSSTGTCAFSGLHADSEQHLRLTAIDWSGRRSEAVELSARMPTASVPPPLPPRPSVDITSLMAVESRTGYGEVRTNASVDGHPLTINGVVHASGLGVHAQALQVYEIKPDYRRFVAVAGLDDEVRNTPASVVFLVIAEVDGKQRELAKSPKRLPRPTMACWYFDVAIPDHCTRLRLVVDDAGDGNNSDHADWVDAGFVTGKP